MTETSPRTFRNYGVGKSGSPHAGRAAMRDASLLASPGRARRYHVVADDGGSECCGMPLDLYTGGTGGRSLRDETVDPASVESWMRCQRPGCRQRWP